MKEVNDVYMWAAVYLPLRNGDTAEMKVRVQQCVVCKKYRVVPPDDAPSNQMFSWKLVNVPGKGPVVVCDSMDCHPTLERALSMAFFNVTHRDGKLTEEDCAAILESKQWPASEVAQVLNIPADELNIKP